MQAIAEAALASPIKFTGLRDFLILVRIPRMAHCGVHFFMSARSFFKDERQSI
jgi:hypothetical protein